MQDYLYSVIAFLAIVIHLILNFDVFQLHGRVPTHLLVPGMHRLLGIVSNGVNNAGFFHIVFFAS